MASKAGFKNLFELKNQINWIYVFLATITYNIALCMRGLKWSIYFNQRGINYSFTKIFSMFMLNQFLGFLTPARLGEIATPIIVRKAFKESFGSLTPIIVFDRILELMGLFCTIFLFSVYFYLNNFLPNEINMLISILIGGLGMSAIAFYVLSSEKILKSIFYKFIRISKLLKPLYKIIIKIEREGKDYLDSFNYFKTKIFILKMLLITLICWLLETLSFYLMIRALINLPFAMSATYQLLSMLVGIISFIPGGFGANAYSYVYFLSTKGFPIVLLTGGVILANLFFSGTIIIYGLISYHYFKKINNIY